MSKQRIVFRKIITRLRKSTSDNIPEANESINFSRENISSRSIGFIVGSVLFLIISMLLEIISEYVIPSGFRKIILEGFSKFIENIAGIVFAASVGTLMLDFFSYIKYAQERIKEVIIDKNFLRTVSNDEKKKIISTLESSLYFKDEEIPQDSLYTNIKHKVIPLLDNEYFEKYHTHIDCEIKDDKIYKTIYNNFTIYSYTDNASFKLPFSIYYSVEDIKNIDKHYDFQNLLFNNEKLKTSQEDSFSEEIDGNFNSKQMKYSFQKELPLKKGINTISYEVNSVVDISDNIYSRTLTLPCKNFTVDFNLNSSDYNVKAYGFAIDKTESVKIHTYANSCRIEFLDWIIPGDGFIFVINKNKEKENQ